ncbi:MAG: hypothetical protein PHV74_11205 [Dehalococcoidia bacterium]|nr:hypothetical protein [Dehalococcoidia bacterium]
MTLVEVQERLDRRLMVSCKGEILTPQETPPLASQLRASIDAYYANGGWAKLAEDLLHDPNPPKRFQSGKKHIGLGWEPSWYNNEDGKRTHRELVLAGMERARLQGKHIGRHKRVIDQEGFLQRLQTTVNRIAEGVISRRQSARELGIGYATLKRLLDANFNSLQEKQDSIALHSRQRTYFLLYRLASHEQFIPSI